MINTQSFTQFENIDLSEEISLISPTKTPLLSMLLQMGNEEPVVSKLASWREKSLDLTTDIAQPEGAETSVFTQSSRAELHNVCEIFLKAVSISRTAQQSQVKGIKDLFMEEVQDRLLEMKLNIENDLINSQYNDGSATPFIRRIKGLLQWVDPSNTVTGTAGQQISNSNLRDTVKALWNNGLTGGEFYALVNSELKDQIDDLFNGKYSYVNVQSKFGFAVSQVVTSYGNVNLVLSHKMPEGKMVVFDPNFLRVGYLTRPIFEPLAKTGDSTKGQVVSELTLKCLSPKAVSMFQLS